MAIYARELMKLSDEQLAEQLGGPLPGSQNFELIKFEMARRAMKAQHEAAQATLRGAHATERYTLATWVLVFVTALAAIISVLK